MDPVETAGYAHQTVAYNSGECLLVANGGDLGIPWSAVPLFLLLLMAREA
jgi:hypothetical protein